jgi:hypothetical protein
MSSWPPTYHTEITMSTSPPPPPLHHPPSSPYIKTPNVTSPSSQSRRCGCAPSSKVHRLKHHPSNYRVVVPYPGHTGHQQPPVTAWDLKDKCPPTEGSVVIQKSRLGDDAAQCCHSNVLSPKLPRCPIWFSNDKYLGLENSNFIHKYHRYYDME